MKTSAHKIIKTAGRNSAIFMFGAFLLFLTSCQKEELTPVNGIIAKTVIEDSPVKRAPLPMILIDHWSMKSNMPDYSVTVFQNGNVIFEGRENTAVIGEKYFVVSASVIFELKNMFVKSGLFTLEAERNAGQVNSPVQESVLQKESPIQYTVISDLPFVLTSFSYFSSSFAVTLKDDYTSPEDLIKLRETTEEMLKIETYVNGKSAY